MVGVHQWFAEFKDTLPVALLFSDRGLMGEANSQSVVCDLAE